MQAFANNSKFMSAHSVDYVHVIKKSVFWLTLTANWKQAISEMKMRQNDVMGDIMSGSIIKS